ncbi:MAG TPA: DUF998 domain-containing protein [Bacillota bacterium]|jgi:hypothetical membrane protein
MITRDRTRRMARYAAFLAALLYPMFTLASYVAYPLQYDPVHNWLSDLGNALVNPSGSIFYNAGCVVTGLLLIVFYMGLNAWRTGDRVLGRLLTIAQVSGASSSIALILSAAFNIGQYPLLHSRFSMFLTIGLTWFLSFANTALLRHPRFWRGVGVFGFAAAAVSLVYGVFANAPLAEWVTIAIFIVYILLLTANAAQLERADSSGPTSDPG